MTTKNADLTMKVGPDVPDDAHRPLVATSAQFRDIGEGRQVLYLPGAHIPASHADLPATEAVMADGVWVAKPKGRKS